MGWLIGTHHASRICNMGNAEEFGIGRRGAASGVVARLVLMFYAALDLLAFSIGGVRGAAVRAGRAENVSWRDLDLDGAWSVQPRDRRGASVSSALPLGERPFVAKSSDTNVASTLSYVSIIKKSVSVVLNEFVNISLNRNDNCDRRGVFTSATGRALDFGGRLTKATALHFAAGGGRSASCAEGYFIPT